MSRFDWGDESLPKPTPKPVLKPYNEFRHLTEGGTKTTIAMAFRFNGGTVIVADRQGTRGDGTISMIPKIFSVDGGGYLAFATNDTNWVKTFMRMLKARTERIPIERLRETAIQYDRKALEFGRHDRSADEYGGYPPRRMYQCVYAEPDRIYEFQSRNIPEEESRIDRVIVGAARPTAEVFVRFVEFFMNYASPPRRWASLDAKTIERFCWLLLQTLEGYVDSVHGRDIYEISRNSAPRRILWKDVKSKDDSMREGRLSVQAVAESIWDEFSPDDVAKAEDALGLLPKSVKALLHSYADGRKKWD